MHPKNLDNISKSSISAALDYYFSKTLMNISIMYENIATPNNSMKEQKILSVLLLGLRSPKPTVDKLVNA